MKAMTKHAGPLIQWGDEALYEAALVVERDTRLTCEMTEWEAATDWRRPHSQRESRKT
jgi:hypothetical protein